MDSIDQINKLIKEIEIFFDVNKKEIFGNSRKSQIAKTRQLLAFCLREKFKLSFPAIGKILNRDHTTAMYAHERISVLIDKDWEIKEFIQKFFENYDYIVQNSKKIVGDKKIQREKIINKIIQQESKGQKLKELDEFYISPYKTSEEHSFPIKFNFDYLNQLLNKIDKRQKEFILERYGFYSDKFITLECIASKNNISRERVRQIISAGIKNIYNQNFGGTGQIVSKVKEYLLVNNIYSLDKIINNYFIYENENDKRNLDKFLIMLLTLLIWVKNFELSNKNFFINLKKEQDIIKCIDEIKSIIKKIASTIPESLLDKWSYIRVQLKEDDYFIDKKYLIDDVFLRACYDNYIFEDDIIVYRRENYKKYEPKEDNGNEIIIGVPDQYKAFFK